MGFRSVPSWLLWIVGGALYGVALRLLFGALPSSMEGVMSAGFLLGTPIAIGALTIYGARHAKPSVWAMLYLPWITVGLMLLGCAVVMLEGAICLAMMAPIFFACASIGGIVMGLALRVVQARQSTLTSIAALPFVMLFAEGSLPLPDRFLEVRQSIRIDATPDVVWEQLLTARDIRADELPFSVAHLIGVPRPVEGVNLRTPAGEVRYSRWERGVNFRAVVTERHAPASISWRYAFDEHSFPEGSMDDHVAIGGRYFDLDDTTFNLVPMADRTTTLEIVAHYRVSSSINFYAVPAAELLGRDFVATILGLYKGRSERAEREVRGR